jgi:hypothetical protein
MGIANIKTVFRVKVTSFGLFLVSSLGYKAYARNRGYPIAAEYVDAAWKSPLAA